MGTEKLLTKQNVLTYIHNMYTYNVDLHGRALRAHVVECTVCVYIHRPGLKVAKTHVGEDYT